MNAWVASALSELRLIRHVLSAQSTDRSLWTVSAPRQLNVRVTITVSNAGQSFWLWSQPPPALNRHGQPTDGRAHRTGTFVPCSRNLRPTAGSPEAQVDRRVAEGSGRSPGRRRLRSIAGSPKAQVAFRVRMFTTETPDPRPPTLCCNAKPVRSATCLSSASSRNCQ